MTIPAAKNSLGVKLGVKPVQTNFRIQNKVNLANAYQSAINDDITRKQGFSALPIGDKTILADDKVNFADYSQNLGFSGTNQLGSQDLADKLANGESIGNSSEGVSEGAEGATSGGGFNGAAWSAGLSTAGAVGDMLLNSSYKGNQGAYVSGAFGKNQMYDDIANTNTTIAATDFNDAYQQQRGITNQLNAQKTKELSGGQIAGMAGTGAAKGAAAGASFGPWGALIGGVVGGAAGLGKGLLANNQIKDSNLMADQKQQEANNYLQNAMSGIRQRNALRNKQSAYNMYAYNNAYGGQLNKKHKVGDVIDIDSETMKQMLDEGYTFEKSYDVDDVIDIDDNELKKLKKLGYEYEVV